MFQTDLTIQPQLFAFSPRDMVSDDSDVWLYIDLFDALDLDDFSFAYSSQGQAGKDPKLMLQTIFYGLSHGIVSGRALATACQNDVRYITLSGDRRPNARTIHRFIRRHERRMPELFAQVVQLAMKMGLAKLGRIAIDGSRMKANTSKHKAMSYERMGPAVEQLKHDLASLKRDLKKLNEEDQNFSELPDEIKRREERLARIGAAKAALEADKGDKLKPKDQKSFHDHDAMPMAGKGKGFEYGYNAHVAVDEDSQIIVGCGLHENPCDSGAIGALLSETKKNCGNDPSEVLVDSAYSNNKDLKSIEDVGATAYAALGKGEDGEKITVDDQLMACENEHEYRCLAGKIVPIIRRRHHGKTEIAANQDFCRECPFQQECKLYKKRGKIFTVRKREEWQRVQSNRRRMQGTGRGVFRRRKAIVEPVFGNIKTKGLKILVTGKEKVKTWWTMVCLALNLEKITNFLAVLKVALGPAGLATGR